MQHDTSSLSVLCRHTVTSNIVDLLETRPNVEGSIVIWFLFKSVAAGCNSSPAGVVYGAPVITEKWLSIWCNAFDSSATDVADKQWHGFLTMSYTDNNVYRAETLSQMTEALSKMASPESWTFRAQNTVHAQLITENSVFISSSSSGFYNPLSGFSLLSLEVSRSHTRMHHSR